MSPLHSPAPSPTAKGQRAVGFSSHKSSGGMGSGFSSGNNSNKSSPHSRSSSPTPFDLSPSNGQGQSAMDARMVSTISQSLGAAISNMHLGEGKTTAEEMIQIGAFGLHCHTHVILSLSSLEPPVTLSHKLINTPHTI